MHEHLLHVLVCVVTHQGHFRRPPTTLVACHVNEIVPIPEQPKVITPLVTPISFTLARLPL